MSRTRELEKSWVGRRLVSWRWGESVLPAANLYTPQGPPQTQPWRATNSRSPLHRIKSLEHPVLPTFVSPRRWTRSGVRGGNFRRNHTSAQRGRAGGQCPGPHAEREPCQRGLIEARRVLQEQCARAAGLPFPSMPSLSPGPSPPVPFCRRAVKGPVHSHYLCFCFSFVLSLILLLLPRAAGHVGPRATAGWGGYRSLDLGDAPTTLAIMAYRPTIPERCFATFKTSLSPTRRPSRRTPWRTLRRRWLGA